MHRDNRLCASLSPMPTLAATAPNFLAPSPPSSARQGALAPLHSTLALTRSRSHTRRTRTRPGSVCSGRIASPERAAERSTASAASPERSRGAAASPERAALGASLSAAPPLSAVVMATQEIGAALSDDAPRIAALYEVRALPGRALRRCVERARARGASSFIDRRSLCETCKTASTGTWIRVSSRSAAREDAAWLGARACCVQSSFSSVSRLFLVFLAQRQENGAPPLVVCRQSNLLFFLSFFHSLIGSSLSSESKIVVSFVFVFVFVCLGARNKRRADRRFQKEIQRRRSNGIHAFEFASFRVLRCFESLKSCIKPVG